jgi:hypothetical protein
MYFWLSNIIDSLYNQQLREVILAPIPYIVGIFKKITILILYYKLVLGWEKNIQYIKSKAIPVTGHGGP